MPPKKSVVSALRMRKPPRAVADPVAMEAFIASGSAAPARAIVPDDAYRVAIVAVSAFPGDVKDIATDYVCVGVDEAIRLRIPHVSCDIGPLLPESDSDTPAPRSAVVPAPRTEARRSASLSDDDEPSWPPAKSLTAAPAVEAESPEPPPVLPSVEVDTAAPAERPKPSRRPVVDEPTTASGWIERAHAYLEDGDIIRALLGYGQAIRLEPSRSHGWALRALVRERIGNLDGALEDYGEALRLDPSTAAVYYNRANAHRAMKRVDLAIADYDEAIRLDPSNPQFFNNRGNAKFAQQDVVAAAEDFDTAIEIDPAYANAYHNRGNVRCQQGKLGDAIADFRQYLELGGGQRDGDQAEVEQLIAELESELQARP